MTRVSKALGRPRRMALTPCRRYGEHLHQLGVCQNHIAASPTVMGERQA